MTRVLFQSILLFFLPFLGYALYWTLVRRGQGLLTSAPLFWLSTVGLVLACLGLAYYTTVGSSVPGVYVPPHLDASGRVVPGTVRP